MARPGAPGPGMGGPPAERPPPGLRRPQLVAGELEAARHRFPRRQQPPATLPAGPAPRPPRVSLGRQAAAPGPGGDPQPPPGSGRSRPVRRGARPGRCPPPPPAAGPAGQRGSGAGRVAGSCGQEPGRSAEPARAAAGHSGTYRNAGPGSVPVPSGCSFGAKVVPPALSTPRTGQPWGAGGRGQTPFLPGIFFFFFSCWLHKPQFFPPRSGVSVG